MPSRNSQPMKRPSDLRNGTYCRARHSGNNRGITEAWMAFQRFRPFPSQSAGSAKSWPLPRPAGVPLAVPQRAVSTAEPRPRKLPPITDSHFRPGNRKVHSNTARPRPAENSAWAKKWATQRSQYSSICDSPVRASRCASSTVPQTPYSGVRPSGRKKEIANPSEKDAAIIKRLHGIYGNRTDRVSRAEKLRESLGNFQKRIMHNEINTSLRNYAKKVEEDKKSRRELKRVRDRYTRDKERRSRHSFISLNALEAPQVPRKAYGLPDEGQELQDTSNITRKTRSELKNIWQKSMRRIALVQGLVKLSPEKNDKRIPNIKPPGKRSSQKEINARNSSESEESLREPSEPAHDNIAAVMGEIDALCTVISDSEDELSDIAEE